MPRIAFVCVLLILAAVAEGQPRLLDDCNSTAAWTVIASDGVQASLTSTDGATGRALRLNYDFAAGSGFCVLRRDLPIDLPLHYRFTFRIRGTGSPNNLEFKLVDATGENVWWINQRAFEFPRDWTKLTLRSSRFAFAWGPDGGRSPLTRLGAVEIAIAASSGGRGTVDLDDLTLETIPPRAAPRPIRIQFPGGGASELAADGRVDGDAEATQSITLDLGGVREFGGLILDWDEAHFPWNLDLEASLDGTNYEPVASARRARGGRRYLPVAEGEATHLRIRVLEASRGATAQLRRVEVAPPELGQSRNALFARIARDAPRGWYPRYFLGEQQPWTVLGVPGDDREALFDAAGAIELGKGGPRLEPFIHLDGKLVTWADVECAQRLDLHPVQHTVEWKHRDFTLTIRAFADGEAGASHIVAYYEFAAAAPVKGMFALAFRPFQVLPPWHELNLTGGVSRVERIALTQPEFAPPYAVIPWNEPRAAGATTFAAGEVVEYLAQGSLPPSAEVLDPDRLASAAHLYELNLPAGGRRLFAVTLPLSGPVADPPRNRTEEQIRAGLQSRLERIRARESAIREQAAVLRAPDARLVETFDAMQHYVRVNADGPRIQPGSRTYERSWIRDGALTGAAMLVTGHGESLRDFLDWFGPYQYPSGKIPCVVDSRGPDPVPEHDSHGQYIFAVAAYHRFTRDAAFLERHFPRVAKAVEYIESLRALRSTDEFRNGPPEKRMLFGLVPESISHEGYSAKPMHSYWDGFFVIRGLSDAAYLAGQVDSDAARALAPRWRELADDYRRCMYESIRQSMALHRVDYVPGCAELGDFDATSTAIGVFPCGERGRIPEPQLTATFDRYLRFFRDRRDGRLAWREFTPYEVRLVGTFVLLDRPNEAHELLDWFFQYQRPAGWRQWGEVAYRDELDPRFVGDMPHTWVGGDFLHAARTMFVYERGDALVLAAGVPDRWLNNPDSVSIDRFPTPFGKLAYRLDWNANECALSFPPQNAAKPGSFEFVIPGRRPIARIEVDSAEQPVPAARTLRLQSTVKRVRVVFDT